MGNGWVAVLDRWLDYGCWRLLLARLGLLHLGCTREVPALLRWLLTQVSLYNFYRPGLNYKPSLNKAWSKLKLNLHQCYWGEPEQAPSSLVWQPLRYQCTYVGILQAEFNSIVERRSDTNSAYFQVLSAEHEVLCFMITCSTMSYLVIAASIKLSPSPSTWHFKQPLLVVTSAQVSPSSLSSLEPLWAVSLSHLCCLVSAVGRIPILPLLLLSACPSQVYGQ